VIFMSDNEECRAYQFMMLECQYKGKLAGGGHRSSVSYAGLPVAYIRQAT